METVKVGFLLPHEVVAALHGFSEGELFYSLVAGTPSEPLTMSGLLHDFSRLFPPIGPTTRT